LEASFRFKLIPRVFATSRRSTGLSRFLGSVVCFFVRLVRNRGLEDYRIDGIPYTCHKDFAKTFDNPMCAAISARPKVL
jgi:hypothetical protein